MQHIPLIEAAMAVRLKKAASGGNMKKVKFRVMVYFGSYKGFKIERNGFLGCNRKAEFHDTASRV